MGIYSLKVKTRDDKDFDLGTLKEKYPDYNFSIILDADISD